MPTSDGEWKRFLESMDYAGGIEGLLYMGGPDAFPEELREAATRALHALDDIYAGIIDRKSVRADG